MFNIVFSSSYDMFSSTFAKFKQEHQKAGTPASSHVLLLFILPTNQLIGKYLSDVDY